jgi:hypothetical protein
MSTSLLKNDSCELTKAGEVFFLTMTAGENRFNPTFIGHLNDALDVVEKYGIDSPPILRCVWCWDLVPHRVPSLVEF